jgi:hypothetical protein
LETDNIIAVWNSSCNNVAKSSRVLYIHIRYHESVVEAYRNSRTARSGHSLVTKSTPGNVITGEQSYPNDYTFEMFENTARKHFPKYASFWEIGEGAHACFHARFFPDSTLKLLWSKHGKVLIQGAASRHAHTAETAWSFFEATYNELSQGNISPSTSPSKTPLTPSQRSKFVVHEVSTYQGYNLSPKFASSGRLIATKLPEKVPTAWRRLLPAVLTSELHKKLKTSVLAKLDVDICYYA